ncbi:hypothetical protein SAMN04490181_0043 [Pseudomonas brenneri]|jgi:hypothetical protein|uniref:Uncharacterized protein n=1 Tax=Pseudomonas brenneri TaxID=129817 RepID=A0ABY0W772_9PSED|nr:hypothetical protein [Pseudomonas sp. 25 R 14]SDU82078.1 hypothetical protein SAMN04490181_0043 [Pseudomonas brenneri]
MGLTLTAGREDGKQLGKIEINSIVYEISEILLCEYFALFVFIALYF